MSSPLSIASVESLFGYATPSDASTEEMDDVNFDTNLIRSLNELLADAAEERRGARMAAAAAAQPVPLFSSLSGLVNAPTPTMAMSPGSSSASGDIPRFQPTQPAQAMEWPMFLNNGVNQVPLYNLAFLESLMAQPNLDSQAVLLQSLQRSAAAPDVNMNINNVSNTSQPYVPKANSYLLHEQPNAVQNSYDHHAMALPSMNVSDQPTQRVSAASIDSMLNTAKGAALMREQLACAYATGNNGGQSCRAPNQQRKNKSGTRMSGADYARQAAACGLGTACGPPPDGKSSGTGVFLPKGTGVFLRQCHDVATASTNSGPPTSSRGNRRR
uniref:Uncharacterized protein n=1 Tax=Chlamydomonas euryale TaxID=1486919 RepID=A0A7R9VEH4_9CHLO|mmetsp:Transcript_33397/g.99461  ORF Transcript_33397/g.99461 Transcript_33397/m.99461 type:complete len:328 (+) Transcript_33397:227-1210(+)